MVAPMGTKRAVRGRAAGEPTASRATYLYCVVRASRPPATAGTPRGLPGTSRLRVLPAGRECFLVVADAPLSRYDSEAVHRGLKDLDWVGRCAVAHERVIEHFSRSATALPMRLFTLFTSDERALSHIVRVRSQLDREFEKVAGRREWGVRLSIDPEAARIRARDRIHSMVGPSAAGTRFLLGKRAEHAAVRRLDADGRAEADQVLERLRVHADDARTRPPLSAAGGPRLVLDAAFLVRNSSARAFQAAVKRERDRLESEGYTVGLTGPWPPYSFVGEGR
jgi:Gas vesicle synthesis protein GvpL/GvpF